MGRIFEGFRKKRGRKTTRKPVPGWNQFTPTLENIGVIM